jgi:NAD(P)-dependent dehydrogenase (short-subunit alcohol dehydrogenase family)
VSTILRPALLDGTRVLLAAADPPSRFGEAVIARAAELRAAVDRVVVDPTGDEVSAREAGVLVWDGASLAGPRDVLDGAWLAVRPAAQAWIAAERPGLVILLAPPPADAGAEAARAGLENLARTLSIEWARHGIRPVAILPGAETDAEEVAELAAFLASPAGGYYSGCAFRLGEA